jgi:hypothetical protein
VVEDSHCLDNRLVESGEVVNFMRRARSVPQKHSFLSLVISSATGRVNPRA